MKDSLQSLGCGPDHFIYTVWCDWSEQSDKTYNCFNPEVRRQAESRTEKVVVRHLRKLFKTNHSDCIFSFVHLKYPGHSFEMYIQVHYKGALSRLPLKKYPEI